MLSYWGGVLQDCTHDYSRFWREMCENIKKIKNINSMKIIILFWRDAVLIRTVQNQAKNLQFKGNVNSDNCAKLNC